MVKLHPTMKVRQFLNVFFLMPQFYYIFLIFNSNPILHALEKNHPAPGSHKTFNSSFYIFKIKNEDFLIPHSVIILTLQILGTNQVYQNQFAGKIQCFFHIYSD